MEKNSTRAIGIAGEKYVTSLLKKKGFKIIGRNIRLSYKEIDIIAENEKYILFVEVKTRSADKKNFLRPAAAVDAQKMHHLFTAASLYLRTRLTPEQSKKQPRIDVAEVYMLGGAVQDVNYIENAVVGRY